ncbi:SDR family NAD(P)-dependent oxidoreductase [Nocardioides sp. J2M5]|nr:SDR family NAD(P)-dependent oxidoreductase [Nocardioides palaemonis]
MLRRQQPLETVFGYRTTAAEVVAGHDLAGRRAVVTGGYAGLGIETVRALAGAGVSVLVPARRPDAATEALADLEGVEVRAMDLGDLDSVAALTASVREDGRPIDLVIDVAGVMATPHQQTPQGWELQLGTNHLGHFALVGGIAGLLTDGARVVSYSSTGHYRSPVLFDDLRFETTPYDPWVAYGQSKTANALFAVALDARGASRGIHAYSVHPGGIMTDLQRHMPREDLLARGWIDEDGNPNPRFKTPAEGASTGLWAATAPELESRGGVYCEDCAVKGVVPPDHADLTTGGVKEWAIDVAAAERLWELSVGATGVDPLG